MYRICKAFTFDAAHQLNGLPPGHKCANMHGHTYRVEVLLASTDLDEAGMVVDFAELGPVRDHLNETYDHQLLNHCLGQPTSEHLAKTIFDWAAGNLSSISNRVHLECVRVSETPNTWAEYRPDRSCQAEPAMPKPETVQ